MLCSAFPWCPSQQTLLSAWTLGLHPSSIPPFKNRRGSGGDHVHILQAISGEVTTLIHSSDNLVLVYQLRFQWWAENWWFVTSGNVNFCRHEPLRLNCKGVMKFSTSCFRSLETQQIYPSGKQIPISITSLHSTTLSYWIWNGSRKSLQESIWGRSKLCICHRHRVSVAFPSRILLAAAKINFFLFLDISTAKL